MNTTVQMSAETKVREAAQAIGLSDQNLMPVLHRMKHECVVHAWQLPALDYSEWKSLGAPIGLAAALKSLQKNNEHTKILQSTSSNSLVLSSPVKSFENSLLDEVGSAESINDGVFEDQEEEESSSLEGIIVPDLSSRDKGVLHQSAGDKATAILRQRGGSNNGDNVAVCLFPTSSNNKENVTVDGQEAKPETTTPPAANVKQALVHGSGLRQGRNSIVPSLDADPSKEAVHSSPIAAPYISNSESISRRIQADWDEVHTILSQLSLSDQRSVLGQLIIVANGQTQSARAKLAETVIERLRSVFAEKTSRDECDIVVEHLRSFARLRSDQRKLFGKVLFSSLSQLHVPPAKNSDEERQGPVEATNSRTQATR